MAEMLWDLRSLASIAVLLFLGGVFLPYVRRRLGGKPAATTPLTTPRVQGPGDGSGWRVSPFKEGKSYRVLKDFQAMRGAFRAGELLVYRSAGWSRYDGVTGFFFEPPSDAGTRVWDVRDEEDLSMGKQLFEEVGEHDRSDE
jgi:hypothetical protein